MANTLASWDFRYIILSPWIHVNNLNQTLERSRSDTKRHFMMPIQISLNVVANHKDFG